MRRYELIAVVAMLFDMIPTLSAFVPMSKTLYAYDETASLSRSMQLKSKLFGPEDDFDEGIGGIGSDDAEKGAEDLTKKFFEELRKRELEESGMESSANDESSRSVLATKEADLKSSTTEGNMEKQSESSPLPKKKFTGGSQDSFYSQRPSSPSSRGQGRTPREMMMEREYQLVGRAERGIAVQAGIAVLALIFYIYVGLSGGIVSGRDAQMGDFGGDDEIPFEQLMPVQRDREVSVWL